MGLTAWRQRLLPHATECYRVFVLEVQPSKRAVAVVARFRECLWLPLPLPANQEWKDNFEHLPSSPNGEESVAGGTRIAQRP
jgi:hypothetical protein